MGRVDWMEVAEDKSRKIEGLTNQLRDLIIARQDTRDFIAARLRAIESDPRYQDSPALVEVNAPLALIQCNLKGKAQAYREALTALDTYSVQGTAPSTNKEYLPNPEEPQA